jgi:hypothetical protein
MNVQSIFSVPLFSTEFNQHQKNKELYITYIDEYLENESKEIKLEKCTEATKANLHSVSIFDDLIYFISGLCPQLHRDFDISWEKNIGISGLWGTRCLTDHFIPDQFQVETFLYGVYFLQSPELSGNIRITNDIVDRSYHRNIGADNSNIFNSKTFETKCPEGSILLMPSYLRVEYATNLAKENRYLLHFELKVLK